MSLARKLGYLARAEAFQWLPPRSIRRHQLRALQAMLRFCEDSVPFYRERFRKAGVRASDLRSLTDLAHLPTVTREEIVAAYPAAICHRPKRADDVVFRTSGTSGLFMEIAYSAEANDWLDAIYARALFATGYHPWDRFAYFWWEAQDKPMRSYERAGLMKKDFLPLDPDPRVQLATLLRLRPRYIYNFPSVMMQIARIVERERVTELRPKGIICHGELMPREIQDELARIFVCRVWNQYGAQEFNRMGWDCSAQAGMHADADSVLIEILDGDRPCGPGEPGELVVTGLVNRLMPLVRYRIGDLGRSVSDERCACGRGLPRFELTDGRNDDLISLPDGREVGPRVLAPRIEAIEGFTQYRLIQKQLDRFELRVVQDRPPADLDARLERVLREVLGAVHLEILAVNEIPLNRRGKLRKIVSELPRARQA